MAKFRGDRTAFGWPGVEPRWTHGNKDGVGTANSPASRVWFTLSRGALSEVYYPTVDRAQLRDLQFLISDGRTLCHTEKKNLQSETEALSEQALGYRIINREPDGLYTITKEIISDPVLPCVLQRVRLEPGPSAPPGLVLYAFASPRLGGGGWGNNGYVVEVAGRDLLVAERNGVWLAMGATVPFVRLSCGYMGHSDGWTDLSDNCRMDWVFDRALEGHIALTGALAAHAFTIGVAFGDSMQSAVVALFQALGTPFDEQQAVFLNQWHRSQRCLLPLDRVSGDSGFLHRRSHSLLRAHEDKTFPGALIASLSIPWGEASGDDNAGGYHLVWTRDMVNSAMGLLAGGDTETPFRALIYLAGSQQADGGFPQNFWINGEPHWRGVQLDEVAFPILLAWRLKQEGALGAFDPYEMVLRAAGYLIRHGPATQQERWEEASGYSPSTLAVNIAALICAACLARDRGDSATAEFLEAYADFLEGHLEAWTVTTQGTLVPAIPRHYIRIMPVDVTNVCPDEDPNQGQLYIANRPPGARVAFAAKDIVDAGFLELVRYGIRIPDDPLIVDSLAVIDAVLKVDTPSGPAWRRYNHDGYGQKEDSRPYTGWGVGRAWPLLAGERGHYELAAGRDAVPYIRALERFATVTGMLPEQVWDKADQPERRLFLGRPTGSAMPLMWAHAEYIKLLRSTHDGRIFDLIEPVFRRYCTDRSAVQAREIWKPNRQPRSVQAGATLRIQAETPFRLRWTADGWAAATDSFSTPTVLGFEYVDLPVGLEQTTPFTFTFYWPREGRWEGRDYQVAVLQKRNGARLG
ncbi:MAG TPA: glycoside hydrolase family 15 protein [Symbiobacteriaceae bacterium]|nr:glycoside hydrolase family 15 protein [Symbiobacteriaceae bacterium]